MSIKFYARSCCTLTGYGGELSIWMANDWPSDETDWKDWSQKSSAVLCKKFSVTDSATVDITCVGSTSYSYVFVRPTKIGNSLDQLSALDFPEIIIHSGSTKKSKAIKKYGPIYNWDMSLVTNMKNVFRGIATFNSDIR